MFYNLFFSCIHSKCKAYMTNNCDPTKKAVLRNITNLFIVSLAVADLCVAGVVMPFYAYTIVGP